MNAEQAPINYLDHIRMVDGFPKPGIPFYDIAPLIGNAVVFDSVITEMTAPLQNQRVTKVIAFDARGFLFGPNIARELGVGFAMLRKAGKLPGETHGVEYDLEYGTGTLEIQVDATVPGDRVVVVDDVIATGGTAVAGIELVRKTGAEVVEFCALLDLKHLGGSVAIEEVGVPVRSLIEIEG